MSSPIDRLFDKENTKNTTRSASFKNQGLDQEESRRRRANDASERQKKNRDRQFAKNRDMPLQPTSSSNVNGQVAAKRNHKGKVSRSVKMAEEVDYCGSSVDQQPAQKKRQLVFFFDIETTGGSPYADDIIEMAASVVPLEENVDIAKLEFSSLCHSSKPIKPRASEKCGITPEMLRDEKPFEVVFQRFLKWMEQCIVSASRNGNQYFPVIIAHNGLAFDFMFLMKEISCHQMDSEFSALGHEVRFADTLADLRQMTKDENTIFSKWTKDEKRKLGMENLFKKYFSEDCYAAHRAMPDVKAMVKLFTESELNAVLDNLTLVPKTAVEEKWKTNKEEYENTQPFIDRMGKICTKPMAKQFWKIKLTYKELQQSYSQYSSKEMFDEWLKKAGVHRVEWRKKTIDHFSSQFLCDD